MRNKGRILLLLLSGILYVWGLLFLWDARQEAETVHILLRREVPQETAEEILRKEGEREEENLLFCFWSQETRETVLCEETGKQQSLRLCLVSGNPELLGAGILSFQDGCLLDAETARYLFGTADCGGQLLSQNEGVYPALGTVPTLESVMVRRAEKGESLNRLTVIGTGQQAENLLVRWGLQGQILDFTSFWALTADFALLFPAVLLGALCGFLGRGGTEENPSENSRKLVFRTLSAWLLGLSGLFLLLHFLVIPEDMIPTKWSDFSFWDRWWQGQKGNFFAIAFTPLGSGQLQMVFSMVKSIGCSLLSAFSALWALMKKDGVRRQSHADFAD